MSEIERELPTGWRWASFGEVAEHRLGKMLDKRRNEGTPRPYLRNVNVRWHGFDLGDVREMRVGDDEMEKYTVRKGDLVICEGGEPGRAAIWRKDEPMVYQKAVHRARPRNGVEASYLLYFLDYAATSGLLAEHFTGSTINHLTGKALTKVRLPLPPHDEQQRIMDAIEALFSDLDAGEAALRDAKARLVRYRQSVLNAAVTGDLTADWRAAHPDAEPAEALLTRILDERHEAWEGDTLATYESKGKTPPKNWKTRYRSASTLETDDGQDLPDSWTWVSVDQLGSVVTGSTPKTSRPDFYDGPHPFYKPSDLDAGYATRGASATLTDAGLAEARILPAGSTLVTCIGATIGKTGRIQTSGACNQQINAIAPVPSLNDRFLYFACIAWPFQNQVISNASSTTLPILNKSKFSALVLPLPPAAEQAAIVEEVERRLSVADAVAADVDAQLARSRRLRRSILQRAFKGRLVPQSATVVEARGQQIQLLF